MILGESAGIVAATAVALERPVQDLDYVTHIRPKLRAVGQRLDRPA
jgi:hypothetical protein